MWVNGEVNLPRRITAVVVAVACLFGSVQGVATADPPKKPRGERPAVMRARLEPRVVRKLTAAAVPLGGPTASSPVKPVWPAAGGARAAGNGKRSWARAGVAGSGSASDDWSVRILGHTDAVRAGVHGLLVVLRGPAKAAGGARVRVDYGEIAKNGGAGYGNRLRLVSLPSCAATTPELPSCQVATPIPDSENDGAAKSLTGSIPAATGDAAVETGVVVAAAAGVAGSSGDFSASSLAATGTWAEGGSSGSFQYTLPVPVPASAFGGATPAVQFSYESATVDGRTAGTNNQPSWIGEGWDYQPGFVERTFRPCHDDPAGTSGTTYDLCWAGDIVTMNLGGRSMPLVHDSASGVWKPQIDDGTRVDLLTGASNGNRNGEHWKITTPDGTQYFFGRNYGPGRTTQPATNSVWTVPVYGAHVGDPCHGSTFAASRCYQAWRWNLDYVEDRHGNAILYSWGNEINYYGANNSGTATIYTRGGYLSKIEYGLRSVSGSAYGSAATHQVIFNVAERCFGDASFACSDANFTFANASRWPDTPVDQKCASTGVCNNHAPTFWSRKRLASLVTQYNSGSGFKDVDGFTLSSMFPTQGDPELWTYGFTRTGYSPDGASLALPRVNVAGVLMANRVEGYNSQPPMLHWRVTGVTGETGQNVAVQYSGTDCTATSVPTPATNTRRCFPNYWQLPYSTTKTLDYFHKYVVMQVRVSDASGVSTPMITNYNYVGGGAWHYDDNELVKAGNRTWGQWRGYGLVETRFGDPNHSTNGAADKVLLSKTRYYRGMNGDTLPSGTRTVALTNLLGESVTDTNALAGQVVDTEMWNYEGGPRVSATVQTSSVLATTATRTRSGLSSQLASIVVNPKSRTLKPDTSRQVTVDRAYDTAGFLLQSSRTGTGIDPLCSRTSYAKNAATNQVAVAQQLTSAQPCPPVGTALTDLLGETVTYYDNSTTIGSLPGAGDRTRTDTRIDANRLAKTTAAFDAAGRPTRTTVFPSAADTTGRTTTITYTAGAGGQLLTTTATNPLGQIVTQTLLPGRGVVVKAVSVSGAATEASYDQLGRVVSVWQPGQVKGTDLASVTYSYLVRASGGPQAITTKTLVDSGTTKTTISQVQLLDAMGRIVQTQTQTEDGARLLADNNYDSHGWVTKSNVRWSTFGMPDTTLMSVAESAVQDRHVYSFDGLGRMLLDERYQGLTKTMQTQTVYGTDRATVFPTDGATVTTSVVDVLDRATEARFYTIAPTVSGTTVSGGTYRSLRYTYDAEGQQTRFTDAGGAYFDTSYDLAGRPVARTDPDMGTTTTSYDDTSAIVSVVDARGDTAKLSYQYDQLGRKIKEFNGPSSDLAASWTYDSLQAGKLTAATRFQPAGSANAYITAATGYTVRGEPTGTKVTIPVTEGALAGDYQFAATYTSTGQQLTFAQPAIAGLPAETLTTSYSSFGDPKTLTGADQLVSASNFDVLHQLAQLTIRPPDPVWLTYSRDTHTQRVTGVNVVAQTGSQLEDLRYSYDPAGNIVRQVETRGGPGAAVRTQCFGQDSLRQLVAAWTAVDDCATAPGGAASNVLGGAQPYWSSWAYDSVGSRTKQIRHQIPGGLPADETTTYSMGVDGHAHALGQVSVEGGPSTSYSYDAVGQTVSQTDPAGVRAFTWTAGHRPETITTQTGTTLYRYDADGSELVRRDPSASTLYLPGGNEISIGAGTDTVAVGRRSYTHAGVTIGVRVGSAKPTLTFADLQNTAQVSLDWAGNTLTRRAYDPYGVPLDATPTPWPNTRGYLNQPTGDTNLVDTGARLYNPTVGRFLTPDPILDTTNPISPNGYTYADNTPITKSDPTGQRPDDYTPEMWRAETNARRTHQNWGQAIETAYNTPSGLAGGYSWRTRQGVNSVLLGREGRTDYQGADMEYRSRLSDARGGAKGAAIGYDPAWIPERQQEGYVALAIVAAVVVLPFAIAAAPVVAAALPEIIIGALDFSGGSLMSGYTLASWGGVVSAARIWVGLRGTANAAKAGADLPGLTLGRAQLEAKFKHAADFGVTESRGAAGFESFGKATDAFVKDSATVRVAGTYRNNPAILNYNPSSRLVVVQSPDGAFVSGWQMSEAQLQNVITRGSLGGG